MTPRLRHHYLHELERAEALKTAGEPVKAWRHLERAHVLSQGHAGPHVNVHWRMFLHALSSWDIDEAVEQLPRLLLAAPGSWTGRAPRGNTGGSDVSMFEPMAIAEDLAQILAADDASDRGAARPATLS